MKKGVRYGPRKGWAYKKILDEDGYVRVNAVKHPFQDGRVLIREHVMVMELTIGRRIGPNEIVHHKNGDRTDNRIENLELMKRGDHCKHHGSLTAAIRERKGGRFA